MSAKDLYELLEFLRSLRKEFAEERELWMNVEDKYRGMYEKDIEKRGVQCGNLDYYIRMIKERLDRIEI